MPNAYKYGMLFYDVRDKHIQDSFKVVKSVKGSGCFYRVDISSWQDFRSGFNEDMNVYAQTT